MKWIVPHAALCLAAAFSPPVIAAEVAPDEVQFANAAVPSLVSDKGGNADAGRKAFIDRSLGNCLACHAVSALSSELFHGTVGPSLDGVASRWSTGQLRAIVVNAKEVFGPNTVMPGFYTLKVGADVVKTHKGKTILTAQQVEDIIAFLGTLK
jgi:sulfur-oxidizing protein SoxX